MRSASWSTAEAEAGARRGELRPDDRVLGGLDREVVDDERLHRRAGAGDRAHPVAPDHGVLDEVDAAGAAQLAGLGQSGAGGRSSWSVASAVGAVSWCAHLGAGGARPGRAAGSGSRWRPSARARLGRRAVVAASARSPRGLLVVLASAPRRRGDGQPGARPAPMPRASAGRGSGQRPARRGVSCGRRLVDVRPRAGSGPRRVGRRRRAASWESTAAGPEPRPRPRPLRPRAARAG